MKISSPAQCEYPVKLKGVLAINSLGLSGGKPLKAEKRKARKNEGGTMEESYWKHWEAGLLLVEWCGHL